MKKALSIFLAILLLPMPFLAAFAAGTPNVDSGGGGMGTGNSSNYWSPGMDGVRVSVVDAETGAAMGAPIDYTNQKPTVSYHFGKRNKIHYRDGAALAPVASGYSCKKPVGHMPTIVPSGSRPASIEAIKRYFCSEAAAGMVAADFGIPFAALTDGKYKLLLEPIAYFVFQGQRVAMTAQEAALYDQRLNGGLEGKLGNLTHQNLPLAMFLERPDLGFPAYSGSNRGKQPNGTILTHLGIGTVTYAGLGERPSAPATPVAADVEYRTDTEVITAVTLNANKEINPDSPARVTFRVMGRSYAMSNIVIPEGESQVVWCKWKTPPTEQSVTVTASTDKGYLSETRVDAKIVDLGKSPPPDPKADGRSGGFRAAPVPNKTQATSARWTVWRAKWHPYWVWVPVWVWVPNWVTHYDSYEVANADGSTYTVDNSDTVDEGWWEDRGHWKDKGWYDFFSDAYTAGLAATSKIKPDPKNPTARGKAMKSGYGVDNLVTSSFSTNAPGSHVAGAQTAVSCFPEFQYGTYWRLLDLTRRGFSSRLEFKQNGYSAYNQRVHFTPVWYPNGRYTVHTWLLDAWTPAGMLSMNLTDSVDIQKSVFDDWHVAPKK